ncbi:MAG: guanylate kinase [Elusimicrobiota bacterium]|jgi:guanylate kinase|nr:guanylate kinase [Elusimicrobiota bacterium]
MKTKGNIIVLSAPSGAGKTAIYTEVLKRDKNAVLSISYTTRKPRKSEKEGVNYFFTDETAFNKMLKRNKFIEWALVHGNLYATPKRFIEKAINSGKNVILEIDVKGARKIKAYYPKACLIFITVPNLNILKKRLLLRNQDSREAITVRMQNAKEEMKSMNDYDYIVINENLKEAVKAVESIIESLKHKNYERKK